MDRTEAAQLLLQRFGRPVATRLVDQLIRRTDGDPALLHSVCGQVDPEAAGMHRLPLSWPADKVSEVAEVLEDLAPSTRDVLDVASVLGREFDLAIVELMSPEVDVFSGLDEALAAGVLTARTGQVFAFSRVLLREICYDGLGAMRRARLHEIAADALGRLGALGGVRAATIGELAHHTAEAAALGGERRLDAAVAASAAAGAASSDVGAYDLAAEYFAQAALFAGRAGWQPGPAGRLLAAAGTARVRAARDTRERDVGRSSLAGALRLGARAQDDGLIEAAMFGFGPPPTLGCLATPKDVLSADPVRPSYPAGAFHDPDRASCDLDRKAAQALGAGDRYAALRHLDQLAALQEGSRTAFTRWYALRAQAEAAVLRESPAAGRLADLALAAGLAVDPVCARTADAILRRHVTPTGVSLTVREREVLTWALRGIPVKEIAASLVLGDRTVETHLASIYRKLGVRTRIELIKKYSDAG